jgi:hypothetical protein
VDLVIETGEALQPTRAYRTDAVPDGVCRVFRPAIARGGWTSLRYAWLRFRGVARSFRIGRLEGIAQLQACTYEGAFACPDETVTRVWELCAYSAHTVMGQPVGSDPAPQPMLQTLTLDRCDRHPWAGDSRAIQATVGYVFGSYDLIRSNSDRMLPPGTRPIPDLNDIPPYTLDWALGVVDLYRLGGDREGFLARLPDLEAVMESYGGPVPKGDRGYGLFFDWDPRVIARRGATPEMRPELEASFAGKYAQLGRELAWACGQAGRHDATRRWASAAERYAEAWRRAHPEWQELGLHAVTNLILGGILLALDHGEAYERVYARRRARWTHSPFFTAYVLEALARMGRHAEGLELLRDYWGGMIAAGATTVWEEWNPDWNLPPNAQPPQFGPPATWAGLSLNHPAGSTPARWLIEEIVGIRPAVAGFRGAIVAPHPAGLAWAGGAAATPFGRLSAKWRQDADGLTITYAAPAGCDSIELLWRGQRVVLTERSGEHRFG